MVAAKANASLPSGKRKKTPPVPAVSGVSESLSSEHNMLAEKVMMEETKVGSFPGEREKTGLGLVPCPQLRDILMKLGERANSILTTVIKP